MKSDRDSNFARVYEEHVWRVYGFLAYRVEDQATAEDLTQTTFERALRAWSRFDPRRGSQTTWLLTIARNVLIDRVRREHIQPTAEVDERLLPAVPGPEDRLSGSATLAEALTTLSEREREVLGLRFGGDLSAREIAEILEMNVDNVHQVLSRSLRKLRALLADDGTNGRSAETNHGRLERAGRLESAGQHQQQARGREAGQG